MCACYMRLMICMSSKAYIRFITWPSIFVIKNFLTNKNSSTSVASPTISPLDHPGSTVIHKCYQWVPTTNYPWCPPKQFLSNEGVDLLHWLFWTGACNSKKSRGVCGVVWVLIGYLSLPFPYLNAMIRSPPAYSRKKIITLVKELLESKATRKDAYLCMALAPMNSCENLLKSSTCICSKYCLKLFPGFFPKIKLRFRSSDKDCPIWRFLQMLDHNCELTFSWLVSDFRRNLTITTVIHRQRHSYITTSEACLHKLLPQLKHLG